MTYKNEDQWKIAQTLEPIHWEENVEKVSDIKYQEKIKRRAELLVQQLGEIYGADTRTFKVLEIGGGATPMVDFIESKKRISLDPLADFYKEKFPFLNDRPVEYIAGRMEELPFDKETFDLIICRNAIDHVADAEVCMTEAYRVLKPKGIFYLAINTFSGPLYWYKLLNKDPEHPYTFSRPTFKKLALFRSMFELNSEIVDSAEHKHFEEMESKTFWKVALRKLFLTMNNYHFVELFLRR